MNKPWATYTWYLFHTIGQRINPIYFKNNRIMCLSLIYNICDILPCPICKEHAVKYLISSNFRNIATKQELNLFMFNFHNSVNTRLGKKQSKLEELNKYNYINKNRLYHGFCNYITARYYNIAYFSQAKRRRVIKKIQPNLLDIFNNMNKV